jgi:hypothetical protein
MNLNSFTSALNKARLGARPNLFQVEIADPDLVGMASEEFRFMCQSGQIPSSTIGIIEVPYMGRTLKIPGNRTFEEWTTTITNTETWASRVAIEDWMAKMNGHAANVSSFDNLTNMTTDLTVTHFGSGGEGEDALMEEAKFGTADQNAPVIAKYKLIQAWPSSLSAIDLAWDSNDTLETFDITWQYQYWVRTTGVIK